MRRPRIVGFEFLVEHRGAKSWVRLQGSGGRLGDGALAALNSAEARRSPEEVAERLLGRARAELAITGRLRQCVETPKGPTSFAIVELVAPTVLACRERIDGEPDPAPGYPGMLRSCFCREKSGDNSECPLHGVWT